jgi:hypothetical protein
VMIGRLAGMQRNYSVLRHDLERALQRACP